jgi:transposase-like protein
MRPEEASGRPVGGVDYPRNLAEFEAFFSTERDCLLYLARLRWPDGFRCRFCGHQHYWLRDDGRLLCCQCRRRTSITAGTIFDKSRLGMLKWFKAIWYVVNQTQGVSALSLQRVLGFGSYETAWAWLHKLRRAMEPTSGKLRGEVEVDEIIVGGLEPGVIGRQTHTKSKVVVAVERRGPRMAAGRMRMERILRYDSASLIGFIERNVEPGSTIITDAWNAYTRLPQHGYTHVAHNISRRGQQAHELMPAVHRVAALVKRWLLGTHQGAVAPSHLDFYLDEASASTAAAQATAACCSTTSSSRRRRRRRSPTPSCSRPRRDAGASRSRHSSVRGGLLEMSAIPATFLVPPPSGPAARVRG